MEILYNAFDVCFELTSDFLKDLPKDHGVDHSKIVGQHSIEAVKNNDTITTWQKICIIWASILHDVDDRKFFSTVNYENARDLIAKSLNKFRYSSPEFNITELIISMIDLVSASKNGNKLVDPIWMLIPRDCDRLEAIGEIGIERCQEYTYRVGMRIYTPNTPLVKNNEELLQVVTPERLEQYIKSGGISKSMIDHYYDKLLHITIANKDNNYLNRVYSRRMDLTKSYIIELCSSVN